MSENRWVAQVDENDNGDLVLNLPEKLIEILEWKEDDTLQWIDNNNGTWTLKKVEE